MLLLEIWLTTFQPDIFEDDEFELDDVAGVKPKLEYADDNKPVHDGTEYIDGHPRKEERLVWLWVCGAILCWHCNIS